MQEGGACGSHAHSYTAYLALVWGCELLTKEPTTFLFSFIKWERGKKNQASRVHKLLTQHCEINSLFRSSCDQLTPGHIRTHNSNDFSQLLQNLLEADDRSSKSHTQSALKVGNQSFHYSWSCSSYWLAFHIVLKFNQLLLNRSSKRKSYFQFCGIFNIYTYVTT